MRIFAHRGSAEHARENTVEAFVAARQLGADGVELDVRRTRDSFFVVHHNPEIPDLGAIAELRLSELPDFVPQLSEALAACEGLCVNVEIKNDPSEIGFDPTRMLATQISLELANEWPAAEVIISSFDLQSLIQAKSVDSERATGLLLLPRVDPIEGVREAVDHGFTAIHPFVMDVTEDLIEKAHHSHLEVNTWTVNAAHDVAAMRDFGADIVITDDVMMARRVLNS